MKYLCLVYGGFEKQNFTFADDASNACESKLCNLGRARLAFSMEQFAQIPLPGLGGTVPIETIHTGRRLRHRRNSFAILALGGHIGGGVSSIQKRRKRRGWPKGKARGPKPASGAANTAAQKNRTAQSAAIAGTNEC
jgi:hypothetical protein